MPIVNTETMTISDYLFRRVYERMGDLTHAGRPVLSFFCPDNDRQIEIKYFDGETALVGQDETVEVEIL